MLTEISCVQHVVHMIKKLSEFNIQK